MLAARLRKLRQDKKVTLKQVAKELGVPVSTYRDWEYGKSIRTPLVYVKLANYFELSLEELLTGQKPKETNVLEHLLVIREQADRAIRIAKTL